MNKIRVHELARKLGLSNQDLLVKLIAAGVSVKTHSSSVDEEAALQALAHAKSEEKSAAQPRTMLRRRGKEQETIQEIVEPEFVHPTPVPVVEAKEESLEAVAPVTEPVSIEEQPIKPEPTIQSESEVQTSTPQSTPVVSPSVAQTPVVKEKSSNVVRVIDADAIRARLAAEGRRFEPRGAGAPPRGRPQPSPGMAGRVRDIKVVHDEQPRPITEGAPSAAKPGGRPSKKKGGTEFKREERDASSGGYELWVAPGKKRKMKRGMDLKPVVAPTQIAAHKRVVELSGPITVNELAHKMSVKASQVVSKLMGMGMMVTMNQSIDPDTAAIVASEFEYEVKNVAFVETDIIKEEPDNIENMVARAPVVTVMGHVDHGKTSILDALRQATVAKHEAGGITQHIGAYMLETKFGRITFLDTPGHEAFTAMRARGAKATDMVVLVVAADDGVMPQTIEAVDHAKAAKVPVVVAVNKMDAPNAKPERVMQQLSDHGLISEEWGGDTQYFRVSALKKMGLDELLEGLIAQAQMLELKVDPTKPASGCVIEAKLDKGRGPVATVLTQMGTLKQGDHVVVGEHAGRIRAMYNSNGEKVETAAPSEPVQILGLPGVPQAGDRFNVVADDKAARVIAQFRAQKAREHELHATTKVSLENFMQKAAEAEGLDLRLVVKGDVFGSVEALAAALRGLSNDQVKVSVVHSGVGTITENDINLARASSAIVIGFNSKPDTKAQAMAAQEKIDVRSYSIIYDVVDDVRKAMAGMLAPVYEENYLGKAEVRMVIAVTKYGNIAGSYVLDGKILRSARVRVKRKNDLVFTGDIAGLKRFKDDVREVTAGYECGIVIEGFKDIQEGDVIECFELKEVAATLDEQKRPSKPEVKTGGDSSVAQGY